MTPARDLDGKWAAAAAQGVPLPAAIDIYNRFFAAVCRHQGLDLDDVQMQLARYSKNPIDPEWCTAAYARQLAIYLTNTIGRVQQRQLAQIAGITPAGVCLALRDIEDLRDHRTYDLLIERVTLEVKSNSMEFAS